MRYDINVNIDLIKNWGGIGVPPTPALGQYFQIWHIELVLRHFIYANLHVIHGKEWKNAIDGIKQNDIDEEKISLLDLLERRAFKSKSNHEYEENTVPNLLWFATTHELIQIILEKANWDDCFSRIFGPKDVFRKTILPLAHNRNRWAHFRPLKPEEEKLENILQYLDKPLSHWMAKYWNSNPVQKETYNKLVEEFEAKIPNGLPLINNPHGVTGDTDSNKMLDRGYSLSVEENESKNCYWVKLYYTGGPEIWALNTACECALKLGGKSIHVVINYEKYTPLDKAKEQGIEAIQISFPQKNGWNTLIESLEIISGIVINQKMRHSRDYSDAPELNEHEMIKILFYEAPWNVIIAPNQEYKQTWNI